MLRLIILLSFGSFLISCSFPNDAKSAHMKLRAHKVSGFGKFTNNKKEVEGQLIRNFDEDDGIVYSLFKLDSALTYQLNGRYATTNYLAVLGNLDIHGTFTASFFVWIVTDPSLANDAFFKHEKAVFAGSMEMTDPNMRLQIQDKLREK